MHSAFVDESFSNGRYFMCAILIDGHQINEIESQFSAQMQSLARSFPFYINRLDEFHAGDIYNGSKVWRKIYEGQRQRNEILENLVRIIASTELKILIQGMDTNTQQRRYSLAENPHSLTLKFLIEKVDKQLSNDGDFGIVFCDDGLSKKEIEDMRDMLVEVRDLGTGGNFPHKVTRILDTIHFTDSRRSRLIQAVDLIAFIRHRLETQNRSATKRDNHIETLWSMIESKVVYNRIWTP